MPSHTPHHARRLVPTALLAALAVLGSALGASAATPHHDRAAGPVYGGTLHIAYSGTMATFDPAQAFYDDWWVMMGTLYNGLYQSDRTGVPRLDLAAAPPTISADRKVWTFHIRKGVRFSNGLPLTADDIKYSITRTLDPHLKPAVSWGQTTDNIFAGSQDFIAGKARDVSGIQVLDRYTIRFVLTQPVAVFPYLLASSFNMIVPEAVATKEGADFGNHPVGTGPFMLQSWQKGVRAVFVRNPYYFHAGKPYLNKVIADISVSPNLITLKVEHGEVHGFGNAQEVLAADLAQVRGDPKYAGYVVNTPLTWLDWLDLNVHATPLDKLAVRQAIAMAIDRRRLVQLLGGNALPASQLYVPVFPQYDPALEQHPVYPYNPDSVLSSGVESHRGW